ncbi:MAG: hypothetical protein HY872_11815, partial [Chloroflexi bacterium]|nr:hypothetical protein [Chloroflexota bacterium]
NAVVAHTFGGQMIFILDAHANANITGAALLTRIGDGARTDVVDADFTSGPTIEARVTRDLQAQPISPFAPVIYSWRLTDSAGHTLTTPEQTYVYEDNRFTWQTAGRGAIVAHWYSGTLAFGQAVADTGYQALGRVSRFIGATPPARVDVYVYATLNDLQSGLRLGGREWVGGHADPALGVVLVAASPDPSGISGLDRDLPHELAHVMIYQAVGPGYDKMPVWLDEGLAVNSELQPQAQYALALDEAAGKNALMKLDTLCSSFGVDSGQALLAYGQSQSVVRYILDRWGSRAVADLLAAYRDGATCEGGVQRVLNVTLPELQADWQRDVLEASPLSNFLRGLGPALLVFGLPALVIAALIFVPKKKGRR